MDGDFRVHFSQHACHGDAVLADFLGGEAGVEDVLDEPLGAAAGSGYFPRTFSGRMLMSMVSPGNRATPCGASMMIGKPSSVRV